MSDLAKAEPMEAVKDLIKTWEEVDQKWLAEKVPANLHTVAARHGRKLFSMAMQAGSANYCLTVLLSNIAHPEPRKMLTILSRVMDDMFQRALKGEGYTLEQFNECKTDTERAIELAEGGKPQGNVSPGGIILNG